MPDCNRSPGNNVVKTKKRMSPNSLNNLYYKRKDPRMATKKSRTYRRKIRWLDIQEDINAILLSSPRTVERKIKNREYKTMLQMLLAVCTSKGLSSGIVELFKVATGEPLEVHFVRQAQEGDNGKKDDTVIIDLKSVDDATLQNLLSVAPTTDKYMGLPGK